MLRMGAICSRRASPTQDDSDNDDREAAAAPMSPDVFSSAATTPAQSGELKLELCELEQQLGYQLAFERSMEFGQQKKKLSRVLSSKAKSARSKTTTVARKGAAKVGIFLGRAGTASLGKAVEALDTVGSSITTLGSGYGGGITPKGSKIGILAFEVANTIVKGFNLVHSLSDEDIKVLKEEILPSEGVQRLVSRDMNELWRIAAADKRSDLKVFTREVVRFGDHCRDPRWHQLYRIFNKLGSEVDIPRQAKEVAESEIESLMILAQHTAELYHELHALDRFQNDLKRKHQQEEDIFTGYQRGETMALIKAHQKHVKSLKKRSLWSKILEEIMEKLVDVVYYLHQRIYDTFGPADDQQKIYKENLCRLGGAGLALHYANIINQIDNLVSRPNSVPPNTRDTLYQGLPPSIKSSLRSRLQMAPKHDEMTVPQIKAEMEKILDWLAPIAVNTTRAHHGFGWVGEWANSGSVLDRRLPGHTELILLQTLHHSEQSVTEFYILELIVWLNVLVTCARSSLNGHRSPYKSPNRSPVETKLMQSALNMKQDGRRCLNSNSSSTTSSTTTTTSGLRLSEEDEEMLKDVVRTKRRAPGISKSQEFDTSKSKLSKRIANRLSKSSSHSPNTMASIIAHSSSTSSSLSNSPRCYKRHMLPATVTAMDLDIDRINDFNVR